MSENTIPAGGSGKIEVTLDTGYGTKELSKKIYVYTNDPSARMVVLKVGASVLPSSGDGE